MLQISNDRFGIGGLQLPELPPTPSGPHPSGPNSFNGIYDRLSTSEDTTARALPRPMEVPPIVQPSTDLAQPFKPSVEFPNAVDPNALRVPGANQGAEARNDSPYANLLQPVQDAFKEASDLQNKADALTNEAAMGGDVDLHDVMVATEKANVAVQFTMQVRNKLIDAYQEIMRMQV